MPFSSVLGASSAIKPGVCTSTTRPSVPYEGQLIYETDTDRVAAYNGSAWFYTHSSGLVFITGSTFTNVTSVSLAANTFSSTYRNYKVVFVADPVDNTSITMRFRTGGVDDSSAFYNAGGRFVNNVGTQYDITTSSGTALPLAFSVNGTSVQNAIDMTVFSPQLATRTEVTAQVTSASSAFAGVGGGLVGGGFNNATQFDSLSFISSVASSLTGSIRAYGLADS